MRVRPRSSETIDPATCGGCKVVKLPGLPVRIFRRIAHFPVLFLLMYHQERELDTASHANATFQFRVIAILSVYYRRRRHRRRRRHHCGSLFQLGCTLYVVTRRWWEMQ